LNTPREYKSSILLAPAVTLMGGFSNLTEGKIGYHKRADHKTFSVWVANSPHRQNIQLYR
jgi:hypothetical protein